MNSTSLTQAQAENFVRLWQRNKNQTEVGRILGLSRQRVHQIANNLRESGVPLFRPKPRFNALASTLDIEKLKQIAIEES